MSYQDTSLWKRTLGLNDKNVESLKESFIDARKNAEFLLAKIRNDFPNLTVHDITHVDSLWNVADTIIGDEYPINPLEGFVLGIAFLIHDAALSYKAVGGVSVLRDTDEWRDAFADGTSDNDMEKFKKDCDFYAIRALHAKYAEKLLFQKFEKDNSSTFYIVDNDEHRTHWGDIIGKIAASHHWNIDDVASKLQRQINPLSGMPKEWIINAQKLACILRCADAGHIDNGRAPDSIYRSLIVNGVSREHWESQNHLCQVCEDVDDKGKLCITSSYPFEKEDFAAWNVAYDAVKLFNEELGKSNNLLTRTNLSFPHTSVSGAESKEALSKYIETNGWQPCSFGVHTSNIKALIENLGGNKLYGNDNLLFIALRELIQNARDAIHARRTMDEHFRDGRITVHITKNDGKRWIEVSDNGIGMSLDCIKNHLLDFGSSYWKSSLAKYENPGLKSKGFNSVGKYGIGFYSVFMVANAVEVITKRYDQGVDEAKVVEFPAGLTLFPILYKTELSASLSTIVRLNLKDDIDLNFNTNNRYNPNNIPIEKGLSILTAGLDSDVFFDSNGNIKKIHTNIESKSFNREEWLEGLFVENPDNIRELASNLEQLKDERGNIIGLILPPEWYGKIISQDTKPIRIPCIQTIGGLATSLGLVDNYMDSHWGYIGYLNGIEDSISRNNVVFDISSKKCLQTWAYNKYRKNYNIILDSDNLSVYYSRLIDSLCQMGGRIMQDNERLLYSTYRDNIEMGTLSGLFKINRYLLSGVVPFLLYPTGLELTTIDFEKLFDVTVSDDWKDHELKRIFETCSDIDRHLIKELIRIDKLPSTSCHEIIYKFFRIISLHDLFSIHNAAPSVWFNISLDKYCQKMIDWWSMDLGHLLKIFNNSNEEAISYLEQNTIPTSEYIAKITAS